MGYRIGSNLLHYWLEYEAKEKRNVTYQEVALELGIHPSAISNLIHDRVDRIQGEIVAKIAVRLDLAKPGDPIPFLVVKKTDD